MIPQNFFYIDTFKNLSINVFINAYSEELYNHFFNDSVSDPIKGFLHLPTELQQNILLTLCRHLLLYNEKTKNIQDKLKTIEFKTYEPLNIDKANKCFNIKDYPNIFDHQFFSALKTNYSTREHSLVQSQKKVRGKTFLITQLYNSGENNENDGNSLSCSFSNSCGGVD